MSTEPFLMKIDDEIREDRHCRLLDKLSFLGRLQTIGRGSYRLNHQPCWLKTYPFFKENLPFNFYRYAEQKEETQYKTKCLPPAIVFKLN